MRGQRLSAAALSASLVLLMAGCGDDDDPVAATGGAQVATTAAPAPAVTTTAPAQATVATAGSSLGTIFVDAAGRTLYTWDRDTGPTSTCTGNCAATWPPLVLAGGTTSPVAGSGVGGSLTAVARPDDASKLQVVWNGKPLYFFAGDTAPGETKGDGVGGTWHVAKPA